jgi:EAL domain-containing protein (putative c-di-GMP-specific phosphodiesterase class I)
VSGEDAGSEGAGAEGNPLAAEPSTPVQHTVAGEPMRVLLVDDDPAVLRVYRSYLGRHGVVVVTAGNGREASQQVQSGSFDVIVSDISMPEMTGIEFLESVRTHDLDVPVILMTGEPDLDSALHAIEYGVFRYLAKPILPKDLLETVTRAARLHQVAKLKQDALALPGGEGTRLGERAALEVAFGRGLDRLWMAFQPIVLVRAQRVFAYEALLRSDEPLMKDPGDFLDAAERLGRVHELGRSVRAHVAASASAVPEGIALFVNLHPADLNDPELFAAASPLSAIARRVVLEVTERASLHGVENVSACVTSLKALGFQIAIDDLGAGYAGLSSFTQLDPEVAKLDMSLVRGIDADPRRQSIVRSMRRLCDELGIKVVAEGVETIAEHRMLVELGCDLLQGYLFARPERGFPQPSFPE